MSNERIITKVDVKWVIDMWNEEREHFMALFIALQGRAEKDTTEWFLADIGIDLAGNMKDINATAKSFGIVMGGTDHE
jgi:hypothetical protein